MVEKIDKKDRINLGEKTFWWKIRVFLLAPIWFLSTSDTRKSWSMFKYGLIKHTCEYDYTKLKGGRFGYYDCKHYGCNIVGVQHEDGSWIM